MKEEGKKTFFFAEDGYIFCGTTCHQKKKKNGAATIKYLFSLFTTCPLNRF